MIFLLLGIIFFITSIILLSIEKQKWMVWDNDHYIEVNFDIKKYNLGELKIYKEERVKYLKQIETNCDVAFLIKVEK